MQSAPCTLATPFPPHDSAIAAILRPKKAEKKNSGVQEKGSSER